MFGIVGMSGAGKSTLVRCINLLERPTQGQVLIDGRDLCAMPEKELIRQRRSIAMIFQQFNLLMQRTCLKNICFPMEIAGVKRDEAARTGQGAAWTSWACPTRRTPIPPSCPADRSSASPSPGPWPPTPRSCCATRPPPPWTPTLPGRSCSLSPGHQPAAGHHRRGHHPRDGGGGGDLLPCGHSGSRRTGGRQEPWRTSSPTPRPRRARRLVYPDRV